MESIKRLRDSDFREFSGRAFSPGEDAAFFISVLVGNRYMAVIASVPFRRGHISVYA